MSETTEGSSPADAGGETREVRAEIEIDAPRERVWRALTEARELERWFPLEARVEPGPGGSIWLSWANEYAGSSEILAWEPPELLRTTWGWGETDQLQVTEYLLQGRAGKTFLRVVTSGFPADPSWDDWVEGTNRGWAFELQSLKHYVERHDGEDRSVVYLRHRVPLSTEAAWERIEAAAVSNPEAAFLLGGHLLDHAPPVQRAARLDDPPDALLRISVEPCYLGQEGRDLTLWLSAWGDARSTIAAFEARCRSLLGELYPEGETL